MSSATTWLPCVFLPPPKLKHGVFFSSCSRASTLPPSCSSFNYLLTLILTFIRVRVSVERSEVTGGGVRTCLDKRPSRVIPFALTIQP